MTEGDYAKAVAQVLALPREKSLLLTITHIPKYFVMMTAPYCSFVLAEDGQDFFYTFCKSEAEAFCGKMREKNLLCEYDVFVLTRAE